jgi:hypothetical protein
MTYSSRTPANVALARLEAFHPESVDDIQTVRDGLLTELEIGVILGALDVAMDNLPTSSPLTAMVNGLIGKFETMAAL